MEVNNDTRNEYALFKITNEEKFREFMKTHLSFGAETEQFGYRVKIIGSGTEPFEWDSYFAYLERVGAVEDTHEFYLNLEDWIQMGRPDDESEDLSDRIEKELCN